MNNSSNALPLAGQVALVTGGSRGIGAAIVRRLARDGADVVFSHSSSPDRAKQVGKDVEALGRRVLIVQADQARTDDVRRLVKTAHEAFGRLDILVNSAGVCITGVVGAPDADLQQFERQIDINIKGVVTAVRTAAPLLAANGRIVSIGTTGADRIPFPGMADYVASKAAIAAYTRGWSRDLGARGITVNVIQPGAINTEMNPEDGAFADTLRAMTALGRYGQAEEIAGAVSFLVGPDARYITGATLNVDGGQTA